MKKSVIFSLLILCIINCKEVTKIAEAYRKDKNLSEINWRLIGPGDADQVSAISISEQGIVYSSTDIGGVYKSTDWGHTWTPINQGLKNYDIITPVIISPDNERILYIGTRGGVFKSINGGETWEAKWTGIGINSPSDSTLSACIGSISLDPINPEIIYAGMGYRPSSEGTTVVKRIRWNGNIYRSSDRGETWGIAASLGENIMIRNIFLANSKMIYVATDAGLFQSNSTDNRWKNIFPVSSKYVIANPNNSNILYVSAGNKGIYKSVDGGGTWNEINNGLSMRSGNPLHSDNYTQLLIDNKKPETVYALSTTWGIGGGVYRSLNGGNSWEIITRWNETMRTPLEGESNVESAWLKYSRRVNAIAVDPENNNKLLIGTSRYIYKTEDGGNLWRQVISTKISDDTWTHRGINIFGHTRVVGVDPIERDRLYIGTVDHGFVKSEDGGRSWKGSMKGMVYTDNIYDIVIDGKNNSTIYVINGRGGFKEAGVAKSDDYGETWQQMNNGLDKKMYHTIILDPDDPDVLYVGGENGVYKTVDGGLKWVMMNKGIENTTVHKLLFHPTVKGSIFAATERGLYNTLNGGQSWHKTHISDMNLYTVTVDPYLNTIYVGAVQDGRRGLAGGVFKSLDGGKDWDKVLDARRIDAVAVIPTRPSIIYAVSNDFNYHDESSGEGIFRSIDGGSTWRRVNSGLSVLKGFNINITPNPPYKIYLSSNGSGAYVATDPGAMVN